MTVILKNPLRTKQLQQGLAQLGEEGAIQVFRPEVGGPMLLGAVGQLQFEVVQHRLKTEYDADVRLEGCQYTGARWITADTPAELRAFTDAYPQRMALDAADTLAYLCTSPYDVRLAQERFPKIHFHPLREHAGLALQSAGLTARAAATVLIMSSSTACREQHADQAALAPRRGRLRRPAPCCWPRAAAAAVAADRAAPPSPRSFGALRPASKAASPDCSLASAEAVRARVPGRGLPLVQRDPRTSIAAGILQHPGATSTPC